MDYSIWPKITGTPTIQYGTVTTDNTSEYHTMPAPNTVLSQQWIIDQMRRYTSNTIITSPKKWVLPTPFVEIDKMSDVKKPLLVHSGVFSDEDDNDVNFDTVPYIILKIAGWAEENAIETIYYQTGNGGSNLFFETMEDYTKYVEECLPDLFIDYDIWTSLENDMQNIILGSENGVTLRAVYEIPAECNMDIVDHYPSPFAVELWKFIYRTCKGKVFKNLDDFLFFETVEDKMLVEAFITSLYDDIKEDKVTFKPLSGSGSSKPLDPNRIQSSSIINNNVYTSLLYQRIKNEMKYDIEYDNDFKTLLKSVNSLEDLELE